jgi:hypothetical protein
MQPGRHFALDLDLPSHDAGLLYLTWEGQSLDGMVFSFRRLERGNLRICMELYRL